MPRALLCEACQTYTLLPLDTFHLRDVGDDTLPAELFSDPHDRRWPWSRWDLPSLAQLIAASDAMAGHAEHGCRLVFFEGEALFVGEDVLPVDGLTRVAAADRGERDGEPELRARIAESAQAPRAERDHALLVARAWSSEPDERDGLLRLGSAEALVRHYRETRREEQRYKKALPAGSDARRGAYARIVDWLREQGDHFKHLGPAVRLAFRELGAKHAATARLEELLCARACDGSAHDYERGRALALLIERWPGRHLELRSSGELPTLPPPDWPTWDRIRFQQGLMLLCAASQDPAELERVLADESTPAGCQLAEDDELPKDRWAVEAVAQVAAKLAALEPNLAERFEPLLRRRFLDRPPKARYGPRRLLTAHRELLDLLDDAAALDGSLVVMEQAQELGEWKETGADRYLSLWLRTRSSASQLATRLAGQVGERARSPRQRLDARQALADLARLAARHEGHVLDAPVRSADEALVADLRDESSPPQLRAVLRQHLDRFLTPEQVDALRSEGLLEAVSLPPYQSVPGAALGQGNTLGPALDDLARKVDVEEVLRELQRLPAREAAEDLARGVTALALSHRLRHRYDDLAPRLERVLRPLLGDARKVIHERRTWTLDQEALRAYLDLLPMALKATDDVGTLARGALEGVLQRTSAPESYYSKHGPHGAVALARALQRSLEVEDQAALAGWLTERVADRELSPYARLNARWGVEGFDSVELLRPTDRRLLKVLADPSEDPALREEAHALLAPLFPLEVRTLQEDGVLPSLELPAIEALHLPVPGGVMRSEPMVCAAANRQHPESLVDALADDETPLGHLCAALLFVPSVADRGADPERLASVLRAHLADRRAHQAKGGTWVVCKLAAEADVARAKGRSERTEIVLAGLEAALAAEAPAMEILYTPCVEQREANGARSEYAKFVARHYAVALKDRNTRGDVLGALDAAVRADGRPAPERLVALDAFSQLTRSAPKKDKPAEEERRAALVALLEEAGLIRTGAAIDGLHLPLDWSKQGLPSFAWVGRG